MTDTATETPKTLGELLSETPADAPGVKLPHDIAEVLRALVGRAAFHSEEQINAAYAAINAHSEPAPVEDTSDAVVVHAG